MTPGELYHQSMKVIADESGVIRSTAEDRAATAQDPPLD